MDALEAISIQEVNITELNDFFRNWDNTYKTELNKIDLFRVELTRHWTSEQKQLFAKIFYHIRGHFHDFLWHMGNHAPNFEAKEMVLQNIAEEFGMKGLSHEELYFDFAKSMGVDLSEEIVTETHYLPFVHDFNKGHMKWLKSHTWEDNLVVFSAYERLDNVDYVNLYNLAESFGLTPRDLVFFSVHKHVKHFDHTLDNLYGIWLKDKTKVKEGFAFIANHQMNMWKKLSDEIFNYSS